METLSSLLHGLAAELSLPTSGPLCEAGRLELDGFDIVIDQVEGDEQALCVRFEFGIVTAGRTLPVFRLMLESNLTVYLQDQAQMGCDPDTGGLVLLARLPLEGVDAPWLADTLRHYVEHGKYWRQLMSSSQEAMFDAVCSGDFLWLRA